MDLQDDKHGDVAGHRGRVLKGLLVRVGADLTDESRCNGPVDVRTGRFVYVPIVETKALRPQSNRSYEELNAALARLDQRLPRHLEGKSMHLDPDFAALTYGDQGRRAEQIWKLQPGDALGFYASLRDIHSAELVYAMVGLFVVNDIVKAATVPKGRWSENAHTRRIPGDSDIVVRAEPMRSGRLERCLPIGEYRDRAYRVRRDLLQAWGGVGVKNGYLQRSARLPQLLDPKAFLRWFEDSRIGLQHRNN